MKKRVLSLLIALVVSVTGLAGCGRKEQAEQQTNEATQTSDEETEKTEAPDRSEEEQGTSAGAENWEYYELRCGTNMVEGHPATIELERLAEMVAEATDGHVTITIYPGEALGKESELVSMVMEGTLDMTTCGDGTLASYGVEALSIFEAPYVFTDAENLVAFANSEEAKTRLWDVLAEKTNLRVVDTAYYGSRHVTTNKYAATSPAEFSGCKLRAPDSDMAMRYVEALGATPTVMALSEVYLALQQGAVDGQENPLTTIDNWALYEVCDNLILTGHVQAGLALIFSDELWQSFPEDLREVLNGCIRECWEEGMSELVSDQEKELLTAMETEHGMNVIEVDKEAFRENAQSIYDDYAEIWGDLKSIAESYAR